MFKLYNVLLPTLFSISITSYVHANEFDITYAYSEGVAPVIKNNKWGAINKKGEVITPLQYERVDFQFNGMARYQHNNKWGFLNADGKVSIHAKYQYVGRFFENGLAAFFSSSSKVGFIDKTGKIQIPAKYDSYLPFIENYSVVSKNYKYGLIDTQGNEVIPLQYDEVKQLGSNIVATAKNNEWHLFNLKTQISQPIKYELPSYISGGAIKISYKNSEGFINEKGNVIVPSGKYYSAYPFADSPTKTQLNLAPVFKDRQVAFINTKGQEVIPFGKYEAASKFYSDNAFVKKNGKWGVIDSRENIIIPFEYDDFYNISLSGMFSGLIAVKKGSQWGFINQHNKTIIPFVYDQILNVFDNYAHVERWGNRFHIDSLGNSLKGYVEFSPETEGLTGIERNGKFCFVNQKKQTVIPCEYDLVLPFNEGLASVNKGLIVDFSNGEIISSGKFGVINKQNNLVIPFEYERIGMFANGIAKALKNGKELYIDTRGNPIKK